MHPFYGPNSELMKEKQSWYLGLVSMAMYLFFWAIALVVAARLFHKYVAAAHSRDIFEDDATEILRKRYASGEISGREFAKKKSKLG
ncbi:SHOCT domain-containing protein [Parasporobacterium paucivorans]|uniref:Short C-terminal domain-containing protein n=1 Tax=Parasporobacterium paucivorans DSM 15970 TaxID=1122934 RepID=A0A1M6DQW3_9FIRM|nr:SHOCT domain-containing protein [Parasporobacterium paucivorans]SHI75654.1 Short C-terminal domain-containing protein [Parasporobacterium paucivorans DSM 15970]